MTYPSKTPAARRAESKARRDKRKELLQRVNQELFEFNLTHEELLIAIVERRVRIDVTA